MPERNCANILPGRLFILTRLLQVFAMVAHDTCYLPKTKGGIWQKTVFNVVWFWVRKIRQKLPVDSFASSAAITGVDCIHGGRLAVYLPRRNSALRHSVVWLTLCPGAERSKSRALANTDLAVEMTWYSIWRPDAILGSSDFDSL